MTDWYLPLICTYDEHRQRAYDPEDDVLMVDLVMQLWQAYLNQLAAYMDAARRN